MGFKDNLHRKLIVIVYHLTTDQIFEARANRDWENYDQLDEVEKLQHQLEEYSLFESVFEDLDEDDMDRVMREVYNKRFE